MKAATVTAAGLVPALGVLGSPVASEGEKLIRVSTAAISHVVKARAPDAHDSADESFPLGGARWAWCLRRTSPCQAPS